MYMFGIKEGWIQLNLTDWLENAKLTLELLELAHNKSVLGLVLFGLQRNTKMRKLFTF